MSDLTIQAITAAINGLSVRQKVIAQNLANAETPGYLAGRVSFEDQLRDALATGDMSRAAPVTSTSGGPIDVNGNNVRLDDETVAMVETSLRFQLMTQAVSQQYGLIRTAIGRGY